MVEAWRVLHVTGGDVRVRDLARHVGWSDRYLRRRFVVETGVTPKSAARLVRFHRVRRRLMRDGGGDLARLAVEHGYGDHAHLDREFRSFAGVPPTVWLAEEFRFVQAFSHDTRARSTHD